MQNLFQKNIIKIFNPLSLSLSFFQQPIIQFELKVSMKSFEIQISRYFLFCWIIYFTYSILSSLSLSFMFFCLENLRSSKKEKFSKKNLKKYQKKYEIICHQWKSENRTWRIKLEENFPHWNWMKNEKSQKNL